MGAATLLPRVCKGHGYLMAILSSYAGVLGSTNDNEHIEFASRMASLDLSLMREEYDDTRLSDGTRTYDVGLRADEASFGGIMDSTIDQAMADYIGEEVVAVVNDRAFPAGNPAIVRGKLVHTGPLGFGPVGERSDWGFRIGGAVTAPPFSGESDVLLHRTNASTSQTGSAVTLRDTTADEDAVIVAWVRFPTTGTPATTVSLTVKRHTTSESYSSSGAATIVNAQSLITSSGNFRVWRIGGASTTNDVRYTGRIAIAGGSTAEVAAVVGIAPRQG